MRNEKKRKNKGEWIILDAMNADRWIQFTQRAKSTNRLLINTVRSPALFVFVIFFFFIFCSQLAHTQTDSIMYLFIKLETVNGLA